MLQHFVFKSRHGHPHHAVVIQTPYKDNSFKSWFGPYVKENVSRFVAVPKQEETKEDGRVNHAIIDEGLGAPGGQAKKVGTRWRGVKEWEAMYDASDLDEAFIGQPYVLLLHPWANSFTSSFGRVLQRIILM